MKMRMKWMQILAIALWWQTAKSCIRNCTCYIDPKGRNAVTCKEGGYVGPLKLDWLPLNTEVLNVTAPENNTNLLLLAPVFSDFRILEEIHLTRSNIPQLGEHFFHYLGKLHVLNLSQNNITQVVMKNFDGLRKLQELYLDDNRIYSLPSETFSPLVELKLLSIQHNRISELVPRIFLDVKNLKVLKLSGNGLRELHPEVFKDIQELRILECRACALSNMSSQIYSLLPYLNYLDLGGNTIKNITDVEFEYLTNLKTLKLDGNQIRHLDEFVFRYLIDLEVLNLAKNKIAVISSKAFMNMRKIAELNLSYNKMTKLDSILTPIISTLKVLNLSGNRITAKNLKELRNTSLIDLNLSECELFEIEENIFPATLVSLHLSGNYLTTLSGFLVPEKLHALDLSRNKFRGISDRILLDRIENSINLTTLRDNPWSCDLCFITSMLNRVNRSKVFQEIVCQYPYIFEGKKLDSIDKKQLTWCNTNNYKSSDYNFFSVGEHSKIGIVAAGMSLCFLFVIVVLIIGLLCYSNRHAAKYYTHEEKFAIDDSMFDNHSPLFLERELSFKFPLENETKERKLSISTIEEIKKEHKITNGI